MKVLVSYSLATLMGFSSIAVSSTAGFAQEAFTPKADAVTFTDFPKPWPLRNLVKSGTLTVAVTPDAPPASFLNLQTGTVDGWVAEIWKQAAQDLGLKLDLVTVDWASTLPGLASNRFDLGCAGASITQARLTSPDFFLTNPVTVTSAVGVARKDAKITSYDAVTDKVMGGVRGEVYFEIGKKKLKVAQATEFPGANEALLALSNGQVDFVMMNRGAADFALKEAANAASLELIPGPPLASFPQALCVNPKSPDLLTAMNILLANYRATGQLAHWVKTYAKTTGIVDQLPASGF